MPKQNRKQKSSTALIYVTASAIALLAGSGIACWAYSFTSSQVHDELAAQKIYFPSKGSKAIAALPAADQAAMNKYAGQQLLDGFQAKTYADHFIAVHLREVADGKTYAQVSTAAQADPGNAKLQAEANTLFKGETLRGLLLGDAYAFWTVGYIAKIAAFALLISGGLLAAWALGSLSRLF
jgi:hypothetical protein